MQPKSAATKLRFVHFRRIAFELLVPRQTDDSIVKASELPNGIDRRRLLKIKRMKSSSDPVTSQIISFMNSNQFSKLQEMLLEELKDSPKLRAAAARAAIDASMTLPWDDAARRNYDFDGNLIVVGQPAPKMPSAKLPDDVNSWREQK